MAKIKTLASLLLLLCVTSCSKDDGLAGTQWGTTLQQTQILLSFSDATKGVLSLFDPTDNFNLKIDFSYTYQKPEVVLHPTDPMYAADYPNGIKATVHGNVMDFSDFLGANISLTKK